jgi:hypothetical protein
MTPLEMAQNAARAVETYAKALNDDPVAAHIARVGERSKVAAETAACLALVAIAEDVRRIADLLIAGPAPDDDEADPR